VSGTTESRFLASTVAAYGSQLVRVLLRFGTDIALARLVVPVDHGLFDLALATVLIASVVRDFGVSYQLVRDEREPYGTVFAWSLGSGLLMTLALLAAAPLFSGFHPDLPAVLRGLSPLVLLEALAVVPRVYFERRLEVGRLVLPEILRGATLAVLGVGLALTGAGVWSFVVAELVGAGLVAALLWWRVRGLLVLRFERHLLPDLLRQSLWLCLIALCAFTLPYLERFVVAPFITTAILAEYTKARQWGVRMTTLVVPAVQRVLYPTLVAYRADPVRAFAAFRIGTVSILAAEVLAAYGLYWNPGMAQRLLLGPAWTGAVPLLQALAFLPLVDPFTRLGGELLKAHRRDRIWLVVVALNLLSLLGFGLFLASRHGAPGMVWANYLLLGNLLMAWQVQQILGRDFWRLARDLLVLYLVPLPLFLLVGRLFPTEGWERLGVSLVAAALSAGVYGLRFGKPFRAFFRPPPEAPA
jgi:O-antigen/teichoic acid export membrane protein